MKTFKLLGSSSKAVDNIIESLRRKGWLERASWGKYLLIPADQRPEALGNSNLLALASLIAEPYYVGYGTAAAHYGLTTQHRNMIFVEETTTSLSRAGLSPCQTAKGCAPQIAKSEKERLWDTARGGRDCPLGGLSARASP